MQAEQQVAALQLRAVRSGERQWQLPDPARCGMAEAAAEQVDWLITGELLQVMMPRFVTRQLTLHNRHCWPSCC